MIIAGLIGIALLITGAAILFLSAALALAKAGRYMGGSNGSSKGN